MKRGTVKQVSNPSPPDAKMWSGGLNRSIRRASVGMRRVSAQSSSCSDLLQLCCCLVTWSTVLHISHSGQVDTVAVRHVRWAGFTETEMTGLEILFLLTASSNLESGCWWAFDISLPIEHFRLNLLQRIPGSNIGTESPGTIHYQEICQKAITRLNTYRWDDLTSPLRWAWNTHRGTAAQQGE